MTRPQALKIGVLSVLAGAFVACGQGGGSQLPAAGGAPPGTSTEMARESYQFKFYGCDTGKVEILEKTRAEASKKLCDTLRSSQANHDCAQDLRKELFSKRCPNQPWIPIELTPVSGAPEKPEKETTALVRNWEAEQRVLKLLQFMILDKYEVSRKLAKPLIDESLRLGASLASCGLNQLGPKCLDEVTTASVSNGEFAKVDGQIFFVSEIWLKSIRTPLIFKFAIARSTPDVLLGGLTVSRALKPRGTMLLSHYIADESNFENLIFATIASDLEKAAWARIANPTDIRELYHMSKGLLESTLATPRYSATKAKLIRTLTGSSSLISQSNDALYQEAIVGLLMNELDASNEVLLPVAAGLLSSKSSDVLEVASTIVLSAQPTRSELREHVLKALTNGSWMTRNYAIHALATTKCSTSEENLILARINDPIEDVQKSALAAAVKFDLSDVHYPALRLLAQSDQWWVRQMAAQLLARVPSQRATEELMFRLDDPSAGVQSASREALRNRALTEQSVDGLEHLLNSDNWTARLDAAVLLAKIPGEKSTIVLLRGLNDNVDEVEDAISNALQLRQLDGRYIEELRQALQVQSWVARRHVAKLLGKIPLPAAKEVLKSRLDIEDVTEVKTQILASLDILSSK